MTLTLPGDPPQPAGPTTWSPGLRTPLLGDKPVRQVIGVITILMSHRVGDTNLTQSSLRKCSFLPLDCLAQVLTQCTPAGAPIPGWHMAGKREGPYQTSNARWRGSG